MRRTSKTRIAHNKTGRNTKMRLQKMFSLTLSSLFRLETDMLNSIQEIKLAIKESCLGESGKNVCCKYKKDQKVFRIVACFTRNGKTFLTSIHGSQFTLDFSIIEIWEA